MSSPPPLLGEILVRLGLVTAVQVEEALLRQAKTGERVGEALVGLGHVRMEELRRALNEELGLSADLPQRPQLGELLVGLKHISAAQLEEALREQRKDGRRLGELLVEKGFCSYRQVYDGLALQQRMTTAVAVQGQEATVTHPTPDQIRVLVVDDSQLACSLVEEGLRPLGFEVVVFNDPFHALEAVSTVMPSIVLSDLDMPGMDGAELCRRLKASSHRQIPVIILTANDGESQKVAGLKAGADDYVSKGASMNELGARIESVVRRAGETSRMRRLFARYTSDAVVDEVLKSGEVVLTGEKREVTALFADLRNFTGLAESLPAEQTVGILNAVLSRLADAVMTCGGTLDKFLGDGLMAVFGAPVRRDDDAVRAVQSAQMMMESLRTLNDEPEIRQAQLQLALGVGINTGVVVVGNIGSQRRAEYTCIGDSVNVAARLCALAGPGEILVGERTRQLIQGGRFEELPPVRLKGKAHPVPLFRAAWR